ncbi:MAG TPA: peptide-binding protein [Candidatus Hydrogenedens sp.]|nr:peptide-binding protein [Candidatus Hydrogenedens sp.]HPP59076.1 peptide-binding protein [Candidatus Hydrogenedens sp.]
MKKLLHFVYIVNIIIDILLIAGCMPSVDGPVGKEPSSTGLTEFGVGEAPAQGDWLITRLSAEMPHLNPITSTDAYSTLVLAWIFDSLLDRNPQTLELIPRVAHHWDVSEDHLSYTFYLRQDVCFSDGHPLSAKDVKFTFDKLMDPTTDAPHLKNYYMDVESCEVLDNYTVRYHCKKPYYQHAVMLGLLEILPEHIYGKGDFNNHPNNRKPIGSGPYILAEWQTGLQLVLSRNPNYWRKDEGQPYFDRIIYQIILDDNSAFLKLRRNDLDYMAIRPEDWMRRAQSETFQKQFNIFMYPRPAYNYIGWNLRREVFKEKTVRHALTLLLNREQIIKRLYYGMAEPINTPFMPGTPEYHNGVRPWTYNPEEAKKLLDASDWIDHNGDSIRDKNGTDLAFEIMTTNSNPIAEKILTVYQEDLSRAGIRMQIRQMEWASLLERVDSRNFDAVLMGWQMPPDPDPYQVWHSSQAEKGSNYVGFINEEADQLIEQARVCFDRDKRIQLYRRFQEIVNDEQPYTFLMAPKAIIAVDKRVHGIRIYPFGVYEREWFVPQNLQKYIYAKE